MIFLYLVIKCKCIEIFQQQYEVTKATTDIQ